jgi:hypothetical protein
LEQNDREHAKEMHLPVGVNRVNEAQGAGKESIRSTGRS